MDPASSSSSPIHHETSDTSTTRDRRKQHDCRPTSRCILREKMRNRSTTSQKIRDGYTHPIKASSSGRDASHPAHSTDPNNRGRHSIKFKIDQPRQKTASGVASRYDYEINGIPRSTTHNTCALRLMPKYKMYRVTNIANGKYVDCFHNDR